MLRIGRQVGGLAAIALGVVMLGWDDFTPWQKVTLGMPLRGELAWAVAAILIAAGAGMFVKRLAKPAALLLAALFAVSALLKILIIAQVPGVFDAWANLAEQSAVMAGYLATFACLTRRDSDASARLALAARVWFGCCALAFGAVHFVYLKACADFVPKWAPLGGVFWSVVTGAAHIAAGIAILSGIWAQLAARLAVLMYAAFGVAWAGAALARPTDLFSWSGNAINFTLIAAAWMIADSVAAFPPIEERLFLPRRRAA